MKAIAKLLSVMLILAGAASALPLLQLDIVDGTYDPITETTITRDNTFVLQVLVLEEFDFSNPLYVAGALDRQPEGDLTIDGTTFAEADFIYGTPPAIEPELELPPHGIYPAYYVEYEIPTGTLPGLQDLWNAEDDEVTGDQGYVFEMEVSASQYTHFDAYTIINGAITKAPFSHDAETRVPEPRILSVMLMGLLFCTSAVVLRKKQ